MTTPVRMFIDGNEFRLAVLTADDVNDEVGIDDFDNMPVFVSNRVIRIESPDVIPQSGRHSFRIEQGNGIAAEFAGEVTSERPGEITVHL